MGTASHPFWPSLIPGPAVGPTFAQKSGALSTELFFLWKGLSWR